MILMVLATDMKVRVQQPPTPPPPPALPSTPPHADGCAMTLLAAGPAGPADALPTAARSLCRRAVSESASI